MMKYYPPVEASLWARMHNLKVLTQRCSQCDELRYTHTPFVEESIRGLEAPDCLFCGNTESFCSQTLVVADPVDEPSEPEEAFEGATLERVDMVSCEGPKRLYLPYIVKWKCPECGEENSTDLRYDYLSHTEIGAPTTETFFCCGEVEEGVGLVECGYEVEIPLQIDFTMKLLPKGEESP